MEHTSTPIATNKRKRSENWDASDKILLQRLIEEQISIIEDKSVDTNTSKAKREAWKRILCSFNKCSNSTRDVLQIQCQWRNTKMQIKKRASTYRRERGATGGGPPPKSPNPNDERVMDLIPHEFEYDSNRFDSDAIENEDVNEDIEFLIEEVEEKEIWNPPCENKELTKDCSNTSEKNKKSKKKSEPKNNKPRSSMCDENLKVRYLEVAIEAKNAEVQQMNKQSEEYIKNLLQERLLKQKAYEADERRKEEEHLLKLKCIQEEHELRKERIRKTEL